MNGEDRWHVEIYMIGRKFDDRNDAEGRSAQEEDFVMEFLKLIEVPFLASVVTMTHSS